MHQRDYHIVVLGSGGVGKSCLTAQFVNNVWIESYDPTIEDSYRKQFEVDGRHVMLEILDTAGTEQFTAMRELYMKSGQGFLLVFSLTNPPSLHELADIREQLVRIKDDPDVPIVLVGNKSDLQGTVTRDSIKQATRGFGNIPYYETSARRRVNVDDAFRDLVRQIMIREREAEKAGGGGQERGYAGVSGGGGQGYDRFNQKDFAEEQQEEPRRRSKWRRGGDRRCVIL